VTLRERFDSLERKLDQILHLLAPSSRSLHDSIDDSLEQADASLRESEALLQRIEERQRERGWVPPAASSRMTDEQKSQVILRARQMHAEGKFRQKVLSGWRRT
jgi:hypothetical protein